jgi:protocatechuate 3,4-dioxygenase beta subunit
MNRRFLACPFAFVAFFGGAAGAFAQGTTSAVLRGHVVIEGTGQPVRRATVQVRIPGTRPWLATTDSSGAFRFDELPATRVVVTASKAGYVTTVAGQPDPFGPATSIALKPGQQPNELTIALIRGAAIVGRLTDEFGDPVAEASVRAYHADYVSGLRRLNQVRTSQTDDLGQFRLFGLPAGRYYVAAVLRASDAADAFAQVFFPGTNQSGSATAVNITAGRDTSGLEFALSPTRLVHVSGIATDSSGRPADSYVAMLNPSGSVSGMGYMSSDIGADGRFRFSDVAPGEYRLDVRSKASFENVARGGGIGAVQAGDTEVASIHVFVSGDDIDSLSVVTKRGFTVSGRLVAEDINLSADALQRAEIHALPMDVGGTSALLLTATAHPDADGSFTLRGLSGVYAIRALSLPQGAILKSVRADGLEVADQGLSITGDVVGMTVGISRQATLSGSVAVPTGFSPASYSVVVFSADKRTWGQPANRFTKSTPVGPDGTFSFPSLLAGDYLAVTTRGLEPGEWAEMQTLQMLESVAVKFSVLDGEAKTLPLRAAP